MEEILDQPQVGVTSDQRRLQSLLALRAANAADHACRAPEVDGLLLALEGVLAAVLVGDRGRGHLPRDLVDEHRSRLRRRLDPSGGVDAVADDHPLVSVRLRGHLAGDHPGARLQPGRLGPLAEGGYRIDDLERGPDGELGVVLLRLRHAPDGHHGVADEFLDRAAVALDDRSRGVEVAAQELARVLGVQRLERLVKPTRSMNSTDAIRISGALSGVAA